jgi:hypothetical protein
MITTDALKYLPQMGLDPSCVFGCASIQNLFDFFGPAIAQDTLPLPPTR